MVKINYKDLSLSPPIDLGIASDYNLFVLKDIVQPSSDTEGLKLSAVPSAPERATLKRVVVPEVVSRRNIS